MGTSTEVLLFPNERVLFKVNLSEKPECHNFPVKFSIKPSNSEQIGLPDMDLALSMNTRFPVPFQPVTYEIHDHSTEDHYDKKKKIKKSVA